MGMYKNTSFQTYKLNFIIIKNIPTFKLEYFAPLFLFGLTHHGLFSPPGPSPRKKSSFRGAPAAFTNESTSSSNARSSSLLDFFQKPFSQNPYPRENPPPPGVSLFPCNLNQSLPFHSIPLFQHTPPYLSKAYTIYFYSISKNRIFLKK